MPDVLDQAEIDALLAEAGSLAEDPGGGPALSGAIPESMPPPPVVAAALSPETERELQRILDIELPVIVRLARRTMRVSEVVRMTTGSIIEFEKAADDDLDLLVASKQIGQGQAVKVGENFGLRITDIGTLHDKIRALRGR